RVARNAIDLWRGIEITHRRHPCAPPPVFYSFGAILWGTGAIRRINSDASRYYGSTIPPCLGLGVGALVGPTGHPWSQMEGCSPVQERSKVLEAAHTAEGLARRLVMGSRNLSAGVAIASLLLFEAWPALAQQPLKTAVDGTFAPHAMPKLSGGIEGFNVDLANEIGRRLQRPVEIAATQFSGILPSLQAGTIDFVAAPPPRPPERRRHHFLTHG